MTCASWLTSAIVMDIIKTFLTLVVACIAARIAWRQAKTQEYKVKLDLFERRMKIYDAVREALMMVYREGKISNDEADKFYTAYRHSKFLLNVDLQNYIKSIDERIVHIQQFMVLYSIPDYKVPEEKIVKNGEDVSWLTTQLIVFEEKFVSFMALHKL